MPLVTQVEVFGLTQEEKMSLEEKVACSITICETVSSVQHQLRVMGWFGKKRM